MNGIKIAIKEIVGFFIEFLIFILLTAGFAILMNDFKEQNLFAYRLIFVIISALFGIKLCLGDVILFPNISELLLNYRIKSNSKKNIMFRNIILYGLQAIILYFQVADIKNKCFYIFALIFLANYATIFMKKFSMPFIDYIFKIEIVSRRSKK